jgi:uncharacterized protein
MQMKFSVLKDSYSILKLRDLPDFTEKVSIADFFSVTKTADEISIVTKYDDFAPDSLQVSSGWRVLKILGPLDFSLTGIIADFTAVLKKEGISVFVVSTFDTDYILVKQENLDRAVQALGKAGYRLVT